MRLNQHKTAGLIAKKQTEKTSGLLYGNKIFNYERVFRYASTFRYLISSTSHGSPR